MQESLPILNTNQVFVAGKQPTITYNPRDERHLEREVRNYVDQLGKALSVSGPTKSGKTVLIERLLPPDRAIWVQGADVSGIDSFWRTILDGVDAFDQVGANFDETTTEGKEGALQVGLPHAINLTLGRARGRSHTTSRSGSRSRPLAEAARAALAETPIPIVVDDFHFVETPTKKAIARAVKTLIATTHVILIAVPHEAFEVVRAEPDMGWRMWGLPIKHWSVEELRFIAREGFRVLGIIDRDELIGRRLAGASYGAPFLMQQLCYDYAVSIGVRTTAVPSVAAQPPDDWNAFFRRIADRAVPAVLDLLARGPNPRGQQRIERPLRDGRVTHVYGAILYAISKVAPKSTINPSDLLRVLERDLITNVPQRQQIVASLGHMRDIARAERGEGDPVLDFKDDNLHMLDPFLSFYLQYGSWELPESS